MHVLSIYREKKEERGGGEKKERLRRKDKVVILQTRVDVSQRDLPPAKREREGSLRGNDSQPWEKKEEEARSQSRSTIASSEKREGKKRVEVCPLPRRRGKKERREKRGVRSEKMGEGFRKEL